MIGIPVLDSLSEEDLCLVARGGKTVHVLEKVALQTSIEDKPPSHLVSLVEMSQDKIITLCKMEIESRLGWIYLKELLEKSDNTLKQKVDKKCLIPNVKPAPNH